MAVYIRFFPDTSIDYWLVKTFIAFTFSFTFNISHLKNQAFDPGDVLNLYESTAGYMLAVLRLVAWGVFLISCCNFLINRDWSF